MDPDLNKNLPLKEIIKNAYGQIITNYKQHLILSYLAMMPFLLIGILYPINLDPKDITILRAVTYLVPLSLIYIFTSIFYYRLFSLGAEGFLKINLNDLAMAFGKTTLFSFMLVLVQIIASITIIALFGLMFSIIFSVANLDPENNLILSYLLPLIIIAFLLLISLRVQPTFVSISIKDTLITMRSAYYYTRDNNKNLLIIGLFCILPTYCASQLLFYIIYNIVTINPSLQSILTYLFAPITMLSFALLIAAGTEIYKYLVPINLSVNGKTD